MINRTAVFVSVGFLAFLSSSLYVISLTNHKSPGELELTEYQENSNRAIQSPTDEASDIPPPVDNSKTSSLILNSNETNDSLSGSRVVRNSRVLTEPIAVAQSLIEEGRFEDGARLLNQLYEDSEIYSPQEQIALFELYANLLKAMEFNSDAIAVFENLLELPDIPTGVRLNALKGLGGLYYRESELEKAQAAYETWIAESSTPDPDVYLGLSFSHYRQEQWQEALPPAIEHVRLIEDRIEDVDREKLMYLNMLAINNEDWENAEWIAKIMVEQFDGPRDWRNLTWIYYAMGNEEASAQALANAIAAGKLDETGNVIWVEQN